MITLYRWRSGIINISSSKLYLGVNLGSIEVWDKYKWFQNQFPIPRHVGKGCEDWKCYYENTNCWGNKHKLSNNFKVMKGTKKAAKMQIQSWVRLRNVQFHLAWNKAQMKDWYLFVKFQFRYHKDPGHHSNQFIYMRYLQGSEHLAINNRGGYFCNIWLMSLLHNLPTVTCVKLIQHVSSAFTQFKWNSVFCLLN